MEEIALNLTFQERDLIIQQHTIDAELLEKLQIAQVQGNNLLIKLSIEYLQALVDFVAAEANHAKDQRKEAKLDKLYDKLCGILDSHQ